MLVVALIAMTTVAVVHALTSRGSGPARVSQVPTTLSGHGVEVGNSVVLAPLTTAPAKAMTASAAIATARSYANKLKGAAPAALEASVTVPGQAITEVPAWVITFTSSRPIPLSTTPGSATVRHFSVVLNATTGKYLLSFFTP